MNCIYVKKKRKREKNKADCKGIYKITLKEERRKKMMKNMQNNIRRVQSMRKKREDNIILKAQYIIQYTLDGAIT